MSLTFVRRIATCEAAGESVEQEVKLMSTTCWSILRT